MNIDTAIQAVRDGFSRTVRQQQCRCRFCEGARELANEVERLRAIVDPIEKLREQEGGSVLIICPNPDFAGPNEAVEVCDKWTGWSRRRFTGDTLAEALAAAVKAREDTTETRRT